VSEAVSRCFFGFFFFAYLLAEEILGRQFALFSISDKRW
jgi:hypothetical protein